MTSKDIEKALLELGKERACSGRGAEWAFPAEVFSSGGDGELSEAAGTLRRQSHRRYAGLKTKSDIDALPNLGYFSRPLLI